MVGPLFLPGHAARKTCMNIGVFLNGFSNGYMKTGLVKLR